MSDKILEGIPEDRKFDAGEISFDIDFDDLFFDEERDIDRYDIKKQETIRYRQDTKERRRLSQWVRCVVSAWLFCVMAVVFLKGGGILEVSDTVASVLLGTTTVNILGLAYIVLKGLFPESNFRNR
jgi:hypothetical protein